MSGSEDNRSYDGPWTLLIWLEDSKMQKSRCYSSGHWFSLRSRELNQKCKSEAWVNLGLTAWEGERCRSWSAPHTPEQPAKEEWHVWVFSRYGKRSNVEGEQAMAWLFGHDSNQNSGPGWETSLENFKQRKNKPDDSKYSWINLTVYCPETGQ